MSDAIWNDEVVTIQGRKFTVKELPYRAARKYFGDVMKLGLRAHRSTQAVDIYSHLAGLLTNLGDADKARLQSEKAQEEAGQSIEEGFTVAAEIIGESTGLQMAEIDNLPGSVVTQLSRVVLRKQAPMIEDFFPLAEEFRAILGRAKNGGTTRQPNSSATSSAEDSTSTMSSTV